MGLTSYPNLAQLENSRIPIFEWKIATIRSSWIAIDRYFEEFRRSLVSSVIQTCSNLKSSEYQFSYFNNKATNSFFFSRERSESFDNDNFYLIYTVFVII